MNNLLLAIKTRWLHIFHLTFWGLIEAFAGPITTIVLMPLLIKYMGYEQFGLWALTIGFTGFGSLFSFGMGSALTADISKKFLLNDKKLLVDSFRVCFTITWISCLIFSIVAIFFSNWIANTFFHNNNIHVKSIQIGIIYAALLILFQETDLVISGLFKGLLQYKKNSIVEVLFRISMLILLSLLAIENFDVFVMLKFTLLIYCLKLIVKMILTGNILGKMCFIPMVDRGKIEKIMNFGFWVWIQVIAGIFLSVFDRSIVASKFGLKQVAIFSVALSLAQFLHSLTALSLQFIFPKISSLSQVELAHNKSKIKTLTFLGFVLIFIFFTVVLLICPIIFNLWLGKSFTSDDIYLSRTLIFSYGLIAVSIPAHYVLLGLHKAKFIAVVNIIAGCLTIFFSFHFASRGIIYLSFSKSIYGIILFSNFIAILLYTKKNKVIIDQHFN